MYKELSITLIFISTMYMPVSAGKKETVHGVDKYLPVISTLAKKKGNRIISNALNNRGRYSYKLKRYREAMYIWNEAVLMDPLWWKPYYNMGCARVAEGRMKDASAYFGHALKVDMSEMVYRLLMIDEKLKKFRNTTAYAELLDKLNKRFYLKPEKIKKMSGIEYPVGWSKNGNFAYVTRRNKKEYGYSGFEFVIRWWKTGEVVTSIFWKSGKESDFDIVWKKNYSAISKELNRFKIIQFTSFKHGSDDIEINFRKYKVGLEYSHEKAFVKNKCELDKIEVISFKTVKMYLNSPDDKKLIGSDSIKGYIKDLTGLTHLSISKIIISPFGNYAAALIDFRSIDSSCPGTEKINNQNPYTSLNIIRLI